MTDFDITTAEGGPQEWRDRAPYVPIESPLFAVFNGQYWDVSIGPEYYSQSVASCMANGVLGYGMDDAGRHARLFASAPDLLAAVWAMVEHFERVDGDERHKAVIAQASRAAAKAVGA